LFILTILFKGIEQTGFFCSIKESLHYFEIKQNVTDYNCVRVIILKKKRLWVLIPNPELPPRVKGEISFKVFKKQKQWKTIWYMNIWCINYLLNLFSINKHTLSCKSIFADFSNKILTISLLPSTLLFTNQSI